MSESRRTRGFGVPMSAMAACAALVVYVHGALSGCAKSGEGGIDGDGSSSGEEEETGSSGDSGDSGDTGDSGDFSSGTGDTDGSGTTSGPTSGSSSSGNPQTGPDCCVGGTTPGCSDSAVEQCVCAQDDYCCTTEWNDECVFLVDDLGCGNCGGGTSSSSGSTSGGNPPGDCCMPSPSAGCGDPSVEQCVCQEDDYCCTTEWNDECVFLVDELGCGSCGGSSSSSGSSSSGNPGGDECCFPSDQPGCVDPTVEQCVCSQDDYCCTVEWDAQCVSEVTDFGCGMCF